jgi:phosphoglycerol transferase MdoB-like AlkP superfamily enzyme
MLKSLWRHLTPNAKIYLKYLAMMMASSILFRLAFYVWNSSTLIDTPFSIISRSFYLGLKFDLRVAQIFSLPFFVWCFIPFIRPLKNHRIQWVMIGHAHSLFLFFVLVNFTDFGFYAYLDDRLNASVFNFFDTIGISLGMVWESYPVVRLSLLILVILYLHHKFLRKVLSQYSQDHEPKTLKQRSLVHFLVFLFFLVGIYGKLSRYPLRWSEAYYSPNPMGAKLAINPLHHLFDTAKYRNKKDYEKERVKAAYPSMVEYLGVNDKNPETLNLLRTYGEKPSTLKGYNVVIIMLESLSYNKTTLSNNPLDPTPFLQELSKSSVFFNQHYTPTVATARGVFASLISSPDMTPGKGSSSRNPFIVNQHSLVNYFKDYERFYFLGGSANWGNIRGIFSNNIEDIQIFEEGSYSAPVIDVWGISDIDLFLEADSVFQKTNKSFFAFIQTSGFHRPYTIPEDNHGFQLKQVSQTELEKYGFTSLEEYNAMRLQDHSLKVFFEQARKSPYFNKTLFVIYGDHGVSTKVSDHMPAGYVKNDLTSYHVPLLFYAPSILSAKLDTRVVSQVDIMPTVASLLGVPYKIKTIGRDLFDNKYDQNRFAFFYSWFADPPRYGLISDDFVYIQNADQSALYRYKDQNFDEDLSQKEPAMFKKMQELTQGIYETSRYMMHYNQRIQEK